MSKMDDDRNKYAEMGDIVDNNLDTLKLFYPKLKLLESYLDLGFLICKICNTVGENEDILPKYDGHVHELTLVSNQFKNYKPDNSPDTQELVRLIEQAYRLIEHMYSDLRFEEMSDVSRTLLGITRDLIIIMKRYSIPSQILNITSEEVTRIFSAN